MVKEYFLEDNPTCSFLFGYILLVLKKRENFFYIGRTHPHEEKNKKVKTKKRKMLQHIREEENY